MARRHVDATLVVAATGLGFSGLVWGKSWLKPYTTWASMATPTYGLCCAALWAFSRTGLRRHTAQAANAVVLAVMIAGAIVLPIGVLVFTEGPRPSVSAQSEVVVIEQAAVTLGHGRNPYTALDRSSEFDRLEPATRAHFPYLPLMAVLGVGRLATKSAWGDMRVATGIGFAAVLMSFVWRRDRFRGRVGLLMAASGPVALFAATGGDDLVVVAAVLAGVAALHSKAWVRAGLLLGVAVALKQTAWPIVGVCFAWQWQAAGWRVAAKVGIIASGLAVCVLTPFLLWDFHAAWDDLVTFPLHGSHRDVVNSPTVGGLLAKALHLTESTLSRTMVAVVVVVVVGVVMKADLPTVWHCAIVGAGALGAMLVLSPGVRPGLLIYPVVIVAWATAEIRGQKATSTPSKRGALGGPGRI